MIGAARNRKTGEDPVDDSQILATITRLVDDEHHLRQQAGRGELDLASEHQRLADIEKSLDQCWDLLRQRRARREQGQDAADVHARPVAEVEGYLQ